ncbi:hypothetical protein KM043_001432 [Ampulex compressa]|nr:hypothetical protein KM043_001432 [Ampulex compressa]
MRALNNTLSKVTQFARNCRHLQLSSIVQGNAYEGPGKTTVTILNDIVGQRLLIDKCTAQGFMLNTGEQMIGPMAIFSKLPLSWNIVSGKDINENSLSLFMILEPKLDLLVLGLEDNYEYQHIFKIKELLKKYGVPSEILPVQKACAVFNFVNEEGRYVAAGLIPPKPKFQPLKLAKRSYGPESIKPFSKKLRYHKGKKMTLKSFPRGGKKLRIKTQSDTLYKKPRGIRNRQTQKKNVSEQVEEDTNIVATTAERLSNSALREGLIVLGRVFDVTEYDLLVSLPGGINGRAQVTDLCKSYTKLLQHIIKLEDDQPDEFKPLPQLYQPGDYVACYVKCLSPEEKCIEDHGYTVDMGMSNVRAFIARKDVDPGKQYFSGRQLFCVIKSIKRHDNMLTVTLSAKQKKLEQPCTNDIEALDVLIPGTKCTLYVKKVLHNGLRVSFGKDYTGYVNRIYLNDPLSSYTHGSEIIGRLMYVVPTVKFGYFSVLEDKLDKKILNTGRIIDKAIVLYRESNGIVFRLPQTGLRGFVSLRRTGVDFDQISNKFPNGSAHRCRVLSYNWMESLYVCTMEEDILKQRYFSYSDFQPGDLINAKIIKVHSNSNFVYVQIGKVNGYIAPEHISDSGLSALKQLKINHEVQARVLGIESEKSRVRLTLKRSLIESDLPVLHNIQDAECGSIHHCTVMQINKYGLLTRFFGDVKGWVPRKALDKKVSDVNSIYSVGQTIVVKIEEVDKLAEKLKLSIVTKENICDNSGFSIGESVEGTITESSIDGVYVKICKDDGQITRIGFLPAGHMAPCTEIAALLASKCVPGDTISGLVFAIAPSLILTRTFAPTEVYRHFSTINIGDCIPCSIRDVGQDGVRVILPIVESTTFGFVPYSCISNFDLLHIHQIMFGKVTGINKKEKKLSLNMTLKKVYNEVSDHRTKMMTAVDSLSLYFNKLSELSANSFYKNRPISRASIGQRVCGKIKKITDDGLVLELQNNLLGTVRKHNYAENFNIGDSVSGTVLWVNYVHEFVDVTLLPIMVNSISTKQNTIQVPVGKLLRAEIIMVTNWFILVLLKYQGKGCIAAMPARRHINDLQPDLTPYSVGAKIRCYVVLNRKESDIMPVCMLKSAFEPIKSSLADIMVNTESGKKRKMEKQENKEAVLAKKLKVTDTGKTLTVGNKEKRRKLNDAGNNKSDEGDVSAESTIKKSLQKAKREEEIVSQKKMKLKEVLKAENVREAIAKNVDELGGCDDTASDNSLKEDYTKADTNKTTKQLCVPACGFSWDNESNRDMIESSSEDEDETAQEPKQKKKKLSAAERKEQERQKEREIRQREEYLASNDMPNSIDQFDRLVLASPDSSLIWLQYMAYHLQATEIEKARAVARRAIKTISFREENERLNVWNAWLNLESKFGTPEFLNDVFQEAVKANDALKVYTHMLTVHVDAGRQNELEKIINAMIGKFKQDPQMWVDCGAALLKLNLKDKSRHIMQRALQSLPASLHVNLMVRFANLENKYGDRERSQTLFEQILSSYPKRVDVWSSYVDSLIKSDDIDIARKVLERAVVQTLPARRMKTLFNKLISFEEQYGTPESVARVEQMVVSYVENQCNKESV